MAIIPNFDTKLFSFTFFPGTENTCYYEEQINIITFALRQKKVII